ncbi:hypothetical protein [Streptomyces sp. bgisy159]|uniref:hypothetical protein n=1 Tax=Streptomyces sp. bgisy159 TaxID=3413795 RepID=UPI003F4A840F
MLRHEFRPGRLVAGLFFAAAGVVCAGDVGGLWDSEWFAVIPITVAGLALAAVTALTARGVRRRRRTTGGSGPDEPGGTQGPGSRSGAAA